MVDRILNLITYLTILCPYSGQCTFVLQNSCLYLTVKHSCKTLDNVMWVPDQVITVKSGYNMATFLHNPHISHLITHFWWWGMVGLQLIGPVALVNMRLPGVQWDFLLLEGQNLGPGKNDKHFAECILGCIFIMEEFDSNFIEVCL